MTKITWKEIETTTGGISPCARSSHGISFVEKNGGASTPRLVLFGGEATARTPLTKHESTWIADLIKNDTNEEEHWKWRPLVSSESDNTSTIMPPPRVAHSQAVVDEKVYIFGGRCGIEIGEKGLNDLWVLDLSGEPGSESWTLIQQNDINDGDGGDLPPEPRSFHKMIAVGNDLYVFGGCGANGRLADLHKFDTVKNTWHNLGSSNILKGRGGANLIHLTESNRIAVIAGFAGVETNDGHAYNLSTNKWEDNAIENLTSMRERSVCVSASAPSKKVAFLFGGEVDPSDRGHEGAGGFEGDVVLLDLGSGAVKSQIKPSSEEEWPGKRGWSDGTLREVASSGKSILYMFGGLCGDDKEPQRLGDLWQCEIEA